MEGMVIGHHDIRRSACITNSA